MLLLLLLLIVAMIAIMIVGSFDDFPGRKGRPISTNALEVALNSLGYQGTHCPHGFRSSASTLRVRASASPSRSDSSANVVALREPLGRPLGFPDLPGLNGSPAVLSLYYQGSFSSPRTEQDQCHRPAGARSRCGE